jgi:colanic acid biosynthesis glycosyl transferase WcaI
LAEFVRSWKPDAVLSGNTPTEAQEPITRATIESGARFYYWIQDFYSLAVDKILRRKIPLAGGWVGAWYRRLDRRQFQRSSRLVAITEDFTPILAEEFGIGSDRVDVVPNWADIEQLTLQPKDNPWSRRHGLHDKFVFLYTGTIGMKHNPALLLDLAKRYRNDPDARVVVISEGIGAGWLEKQTAEAGLENLLLLPYQPFTELPDVLAAGDTLVTLLEEDAGIFSVPSKVLSYLCAGRPLLLSVPAANLAARITRENGAGLTVPPGDSDAFLAAAAELRESREKRERFANNARTYAERNFPIDQTASAFERILSSAA